jgi:hypothetical protein
MPTRKGPRSWWSQKKARYADDHRNGWAPTNGTDGSRRSNGSPKPRTETRRTLMNDSDNTTGYHSHMLVDAPGPAPDRRVNDPRVNDLNAAFL